MNAKCLYADNFDPLDLSHIDIIDTIREIYGEVHLLIISESECESGMLVPIDIRLNIMERHFKNDKNIKISIFDNGFISDYASDNGIKFLIKRLTSNILDDLKDDQIIEIIHPEMRTIYVPVNAKLRHIQTSIVQNIISKTGWERIISDMVPQASYKYLFLHHAGGKKNFINLVKSLCGVGAVPKDRLNKIYDDIYSVYSSDKRVYHNLIHIFEMLTELNTININELTEAEGEDAVEIIRQHIGELELAIWYHDKEQNPDDHANDELHSSLALEKDSKYVGMLEENYTLASTLVKATKHELDLTDASFLEKLISDLDLFIWGKSSIEEYFKLVKNVRKEIPISDISWCKNRIAFLKKLLDKKRIYYTDYFHKKYEKNLIRNITIELKNLNENLNDLQEN